VTGEFTTDVAVIGAGPVGLFAVFECGMLKMRCHVVDALPAIGGQCTALYPEKPIYDIPAAPELTASELIDRLHLQVAPFAPQFHLGQQAVELHRRADTWELVTSAGNRIRARAVILAAGAGAFGPNRPPLAGIEGYEGRSVHYLFNDLARFRGQRLVIAGGGDSAVDWAIALADLAAEIHVVHRRDRFRAAPESAARLEQLAATGKLRLVIPYQLAGLEGDGQKLSAVLVKTLAGEQRRIEADHLLAFFGLATKLGPINDWGLEAHNGAVPVDPATCATAARGVFAIGDIASYPRKLKLILTGFAEAAHAAHAAYELVNPGRALHFEYSTSTGVPGR
jgi:thioredoxin reductase (NADPH)